MLACLAKISPLNVLTGTRFDVYLSSVGDRVNGPLVNGLNGVTWEPATITPPSLAIQLWNGDFTASVQPGQAVLPINVGTAKKSYPAIDTATWTGAPIEIYVEEPGTAWPWTKRFSGRVTSWDGAYPRLTLTAEVDQQPFAANVLTAAYAGTGGIEGGADLKNQPKPLVLGWAQNVEPVLINAVDSVYQFSGYGPIETVSTLYERGADFGASVNDYASYAALVAATIPAGRWATCLAQGLIRLGAPAYGVITGDVRGHRVGSTTPRLTGSIVSALATIAGVSSSAIETASLSALDSAVPYPINIVLTAQETFLDLARRLVLPCNWTAGVSLVGKFFVAGIGLGGPEVITLNAQGRAVPQVLTAQEETVSPPYTKTTMGAARSWRVHSADEISFQAALIERGRYDSATTYREGNIVDVEDGSRWVYVAVTASAGNAPPAWPTTSNTWWESLTPPATGDRVESELSAPNQSITAASNGSVSSYAALGGVFTLRLNNAPITTGVVFSVLSETGMDVSINAETGAYVVNSMSANTGTAVFRATYSGFTFDKTYTVSKVLQGTPGAGGAGTPATSIVTSKKAINVFAYADGNVPASSFADAVGQMTVFSGNTDVTASASLSATPAGCTGTINTAANTPVAGRPKGYYEITAMSPSVDSATLTLQATYGGNTLTEIFSISKNKTGFEIVGALPSTNLFDGRQVYLTADKKLYTYKGIPGSGGAWSKTVDGADIQAASIDTAKFAAGIEPVTNVTDLPLTRVTSTVSYNGELYRWNGIAYTKAVATSDLTGLIGSSKLAIGVGSNMLSGCLPGRNPNSYAHIGWNPDNIGHLVGPYGPMISTYDSSWGDGVTLGPEWSTNDHGTFALYQNNATTGANNAVDVIIGRPLDLAGTWDQKWSAEAAKTYEFSVYTGAHRCNVEIGLGFMNSAGAWITGYPGEGTTDSNNAAKAGGNTLDGYKRLVVRIKAPAGTAFAYPYIRKHNTAAGQTDSWMFMNRPMLAETSANATEALPWNPPAEGLFSAENILFNSMDGNRLKANSVETQYLKVGSNPANLVTNPKGAEGTVSWSLAEGSPAASFHGGYGWFATGRSGFWIDKSSTSDITAYGCRAFPVKPGKTYSVKLSTGASASTGAGKFLRINYMATEPANGVINTGNRTGWTELVNNGPWTAGGPVTEEFTWTCPAGVYWASFAIYNWVSGPLEVYFSDLEISEQIGSVEIGDGAIKTPHLEADSVTAAKIAAGAVGTDELAAQAATVGKLVVTDFNNLILNGDFITGNLDGWSRPVTPGGSVIVAAADAPGGSWPSKYGLIMHRAAGATGELSIVNGNIAFDHANAWANGIPMEPGDEIYIEGIAYAESGAKPRIDGVCRPNDSTIYLLDAVALQNATNDANNLYPTPGAFVPFKGYFRNNTGSRVKAWFRFWHDPTSSGNTSLYWWNLKARRRNSGSLIVDGAIKAQHVETHTLTADQVAFGTLTGAQMAVTEIIAYSAQIKDLTVDTIHVKDNAITSSIAAYTNGDAYVPLDSHQVVQSLSFIAVAGQPVHIQFGVALRAADGSASTFGVLRLYRNSSELFRMSVFGTSADISNFWSFPFVDTPSAGSVVYELTYFPNNAIVPEFGAASNNGAYVSKRSLLALQTKK